MVAETESRFGYAHRSVLGLATLATLSISSLLRTFAIARSITQPYPKVYAKSCASVFSSSATDTSLPQSIIASLPGADTDVIQSPNTEAWSDQSQHSHIDTFPAHANPVRFRLEIHFKVSKGILMKTVDANEGDDILSIAHEYDIDWYVSFRRPGHPPYPLFLPRWWIIALKGACEGSVACSTCHAILDPESYENLPQPEV